MPLALAIPLLDTALHLVATVVDHLPTPDPALRMARLQARHDERMARMRVREARATRSP